MYDDRIGYERILVNRQIALMKRNTISAAEDRVRSIQLDPTGKRIGLPDTGTTAIVDLLELLAGKPRKQQSSRACLKEPNQESLRETGKCLLLRKEKCAIYSEVI